MTISKFNGISGVSRHAVAIAALAATCPAFAQSAEQPVTLPDTAAQSDTAQTDAQLQDAAPAEGDIIVTGIRQSLQGALTAKRNSAQVLDAISAEDIGKFPDKNIGEALQRVTGVQITRAAGEGQSISIRGAEPGLNRVEINGQTALSTTVAGGRGVEFRDLPAEFVSRLEVVKSVTADMTEGGLGGTVRIITRRPFDSKEPYLAGSAQGIYSTLADKVDPKVAVIGSTTFADDTMGILLSATYEERSLWYDQARTTGWRQIDANPTQAGVQALDLNADGVGDFYPDIPRYVINRESTKRYAINGIYEYRPNDDFRAFIEGTYTHSTLSLDSQFLQLSTVQNVVDGGVNRGETVIGPDNTATTVTFDGALAAPGGLGVDYRNILGDQKRRTFNGQIGWDWTVADNLKLSLRGGYSKSRAFNDEINATGAARGVSSLTIDYDIGEQAPDIILPFDPTTTAGIQQLTVLRRPRYNDQTEYDAKFDAEYTPDNGGFITSLKAGVQRRKLDADSRYFDATLIYNGVTGQTTLNNYDTGVSTTAVIATTTPAALTQRVQDLIGDNATLGDHDFFDGGGINFSIPRWLNLGNAVAEAGGIPDPFVNPVPLDTWDVGETNLAGYVQSAFEFDPGFLIQGVIGARVVNTKTRATGSQITTAGGVTTVAPVAFDGEYTEFLPSLNLKAEFIPDTLLGRITATEVIARPNPAQLAPRFVLDAVGFTGSRGNPALNPYRARQYDAGLEYYINRTSYLSATYFRKEISSFIQNGTETFAGTDVNGLPRDYTITVPVNGNSKVTINGVEAGGQLSFDFLPGLLANFGAIANYTYSKDSGYTETDFFTGALLPFQGLSRHSYNISGFYEDETFSLRASYNWRSEYLIVARGRGNNPEFGEAFGQWDASASVNLTPKVSLFFEGVNIFNAERYENANSIYRRTLLETYGRRYYAGIRARF